MATGPQGQAEMGRPRPPGQTALQLLLAALVQPLGPSRGNQTLDLSLRLADQLPGMALTRVGELRQQEVAVWEAAVQAAVAAVTARKAARTDVEATAATAAAAAPAEESAAAGPADGSAAMET